MIVGLDFEEALESLHDEMDLLENKRVLIDAKGTGRCTVYQCYTSWLFQETPS